MKKYGVGRMDTIYPTFIENGRLNIDNIDQNELPLKIELIDLDAKIIFSKIINEKFYDINLNVSNGMYLCRISNNKMVKIIKIIIQS